VISSSTKQRAFADAWARYCDGAEVVSSVGVALGLILVQPAAE
jgi:hypothetical protein